MGQEIWYITLPHSSSASSVTQTHRISTAFLLSLAKVYSLTTETCFPRPILLPLCGAIIYSFHGNKEQCAALANFLNIRQELPPNHHLKYRELPYVMQKVKHVTSM